MNRHADISRSIDGRFVVRSRFETCGLQMKSIRGMFSRRSDRVAALLILSSILASLFTMHADPAIAEDAETNTAETKAFSPEQLTFFEKRVRPLLIKSCYKCHGAEKQQGGLRLDSRASILKGGDSGPAVNLADPKSSLLLEAVSYAPDAVVEMPPDSRLEKADVAALSRWVAQGLAWPGAAIAGNKPSGSNDHPGGDVFTAKQKSFWAFQPVKRPDVPNVKNQDWVKNEVDQFVLAQLEHHELSPSPPADKRTLIRRATFDLTGLPPTPAEIDAFLTDESPGALSKVVGRLLASAQYGERWGRHWLDVVRYADSNGMDENLAHSNAFRYRDYVIDAFNSDKPYDQFVREQIAGDLMPDKDDERATLERLVATGFLAIGPKMLAEDDPVKMEMDIIDEQIDTIGKCFMGMSLGCARCHDHKFDPVTTADYYALAGIFKSTKTMNNFSVVAQWFERPVDSDSVVKSYREYESLVAAQQKSISDLQANANREFLSTARPRVTDYLLAATQYADSVKAITQFVAKLNTTPPADDSPYIHIQAEDFTRGNVDRLVQTQQPRVEIIGTYKNGKSSAEYDIPPEHVGPHVVFLRYAAAGRRPLSLSLNGSVVKAEAADQVTGRWDADGQRWFFETTIDLREDGGNTIRLECTKLFPHVDRLLLVPAESISGSSREVQSLAAIAKRADLNPAVLEQFVGDLEKSRGDANSIFAPWHRLNEALAIASSAAGENETLLSTLAERATQSARVEFLRYYRETFDKAEVAWKTLQSVSAGEKAKSLPDAQLEAFRSFLYDPAGTFRLPKNVEEFYASNVRKQLADHREQLRSTQASAPEPLNYAMGVTDGTVQNAHICVRGNHVNLGDEVPRRFLSIVDDGSQSPVGSESSGRRELAEWLTTPNHPLTSRTIVNRAWRWHFGAGLVRTPDNLGLTGEPPSNQALLDWLADRFVHSGWSLKRLHRSIMLSSTYQMSTDYNAQAAAVDPENRLLWRMNRRRLEAEAIRDSVLAVAGTLDLKPGAAPLLIKNRAYVTSTASNLTVEFNNAVRSVYQPIIRSALYEMFQAFDFPDPSALQGDRSTTTVAPQALFMLNSPFLDKHTEAMAARLIAEHPEGGTERMTRSYALAFGREPTEQERGEAGQFLKEYASQLSSDEQAGARCELLAWKALCRVLLSSSEFLYVE